MSIKKNGKLIAGNYNNINIKELTGEVTDQLNKIQTASDTAVNTITDIGNNYQEEMLANIENMNSIANSVKQLANIIGASSVGVEKFWRGQTAPVNYLIENGQLVSREEYTDLYQWAIENNLIIEDSDWTTNKKYGFYSYGDGSTTFRLPDLRNYYLVGYDENYHSGLGVHQDDTLPNLTGTFNISGTNESSATIETTATGIFKINTKTERAYPITGSTTLTDNIVENIELDLSTQIKTSDRVQPRSIPVNFIVCYKNIWSN